MNKYSCTEEQYLKAEEQKDISNGTGCPYCGVVYSFVFNMQFHKKDCPIIAGVPCNIFKED